jgi:hypothetical protein
VENLVENFRGGGGKSDQEGAFTTPSVGSVKEKLEKKKEKCLYCFVTLFVTHNVKTLLMRQDGISHEYND